MLLLGLVTLAFNDSELGSGEVGSGTVSVLCTEREWVDVDSPDSACTSPSSRDGSELQLVFSDEFARPHVETTPR